ncbi:MAG: hypothetical protein FWF84_02625, partial [Kiritimatiellaeota bacterium]|nr:hypothetical protein [Kiritimatiellota bacterium]
GYSQETGALPFPHPELRSEKARRILHRTLPYVLLAQEDKKLDRILSDEKPASIKALASAFYDANKDGTPAALALQYAVLPESFLNEKAFDYFRQQAKAAPIPELEAFFRTVEFTPPEIIGDLVAHTLIGHLVCYAALRGDERPLKDYADRLEAFAPQCEKRIQDELRKDAQKLREMSLPLSDEAVWRLFETDEGCAEIVSIDDQAGLPLVMTLCAARLDDLPLQEMVATVLKHTTPRHPERYKKLIERRIHQREGGLEKVRGLIRVTDEWRTVADSDETWHNFYYLYGQLFEDDFWNANNRAGSHFKAWEKSAAFWKTRLLARLDNTELPPLPWIPASPAED